jgi:RNA polymerase sigma-70 factor (ECF subfamily)
LASRRRSEHLSGTGAALAPAGAARMTGSRTDGEALAREAIAHVDTLHRLARRLTGDDRDAEDLVQETYAHALAALDRFEPGTDLRAWLLRILRNAHVSAWRRARHGPRALEDEADPEGPVADDPFLRGELGPEQLRAVVGTEIEAALAALGPDARAVVLLHLEGLTDRELAEVMGWPIGTVKSRLFRARAALRSRLAPYARRAGP